MKPDRGDGTFQNPVLYADYSDPDAIRVGDDYYMVASSFQCTPGLPILHSKDLRQLGRSSRTREKNLPDALRGGAAARNLGTGSAGARGKFYPFAPDSDEGIYVLTALHPRSLEQTQAPCGGKRAHRSVSALGRRREGAYLSFTRTPARAPGIRDRLRVVAMAPDATGLLDDGKIVFMGPSASRPSKGRSSTRRTAGITSSLPRVAFRRAGKSCFARAASTDRTRIATCLRKGAPP